MTDPSYQPAALRAVLWAQFFSSLADNALFMVCIAFFATVAAPVWMMPSLKFLFVLPYVLLAPVVGAVADAWPKGQVMLWSNLAKIVACVLLLFGVSPVLACLVAGFGAAAYSPAKYAILAEILPQSSLVIANAWIEGLTILSIILGTALGGALASGPMADYLQQYLSNGLHTALLVLVVIYLAAALVNFLIPRTGVKLVPLSRGVAQLLPEFKQAMRVLWSDPLARIGLSVGTLFWGACAALQLLVLDWSVQQLGLSVDRGSLLLGVLAFSVALGAAAAARFVPLTKALSVLWLGVLMGGVAMLLAWVHSVWMLVLLLAVAGALGGFFVVPMYALLQSRGPVVSHGGQTIAVQNFSENLSVLLMMLTYGGLRAAGVSLSVLIVLFGAIIVVGMVAVLRMRRKVDAECVSSV